MEIQGEYRGREHSFIKHELLRGYLQKLFLIKGTSGSKQLTFVDCFAGPWGSDDSDLEGTSISLSLSLLKDIRETLGAQGKHDISLRAIYVEENKKRFEKLQLYLQREETQRVRTYPIFGDFADEHDNILSICGSGFTLFFLDPTGWKQIAIDRIRPFLNQPQSEFIITFMYDFINRAIGIQSLRDTVESVLGRISEDELARINSLPSQDRENHIVKRYRETLCREMHNEKSPIPRSLHLSVLDRTKERTKYHLVYLSRHPKGIIEFARKSESLEVVQRQIRFQVLHSVVGQVDLFGFADLRKSNPPKDEMEAMKQYWLNILQSNERKFGEPDLANMLEETGWYERDLRRSFAELEADGLVENCDSLRKRPKRPVHFEKNERLRRAK